MRQILLHQTRPSKLDPSNLVHLDPWTILDNKGTVKDEEFTLVGFVKQVPFKHIDVDFQTFYGNPYLAVGKYAVFSDKAGNWSADKHIITNAIVAKEQ